jgi:hypothetical protein
MQNSQPVTVDFLHPTVTRTFKNWGYISFYGCMALLIVLMFFAINSVKQTYAAREQRTQAAPVASTELVPVVALNAATSDQSFVYSNSELGFSVDFSKVLDVFLPRIYLAPGVRAQPSDLRMTEKQINVGSSVTYSVPGDQTCEGTPCSILSVAWQLEPGVTITQLEARQRAEASNYKSMFAPKIERRLVNGQVVLAIEYPDASGLCDGSGEVSGTYIFLRGDSVVTLVTRCGAIDVSKEIQIFD